MIECPALPPGSLAQSVEQRTFNPLVAGSNPARPTIGTEVRWHRVRTPGLLAQLVEQRTLNPLVAGSNPAGPTNHHAGGSRSGHLPAFGGNEAVRLRNAVRVPHRMGIRMSDHTSSDLQPHQRLKASAIDSDFGVDVYALVLSRLGVRLDQFGHDRETQGRRIGHWLRRLQDRKPIEPSSLRQLIEQIHLADEASRDGRLRVLTPPSHGQALGYASQTRPEWFSEWARDALMVRSLKAVNRLSTVFVRPPRTRSSNTFLGLSRCPRHLPLLRLMFGLSNSGSTKKRKAQLCNSWIAFELGASSVLTTQSRPSRWRT